jgi:hypothetical protein
MAEGHGMRCQGEIRPIALKERICQMLFPSSTDIQARCRVYEASTIFRGGNETRPQNGWLFNIKIQKMGAGADVAAKSLPRF